ncbi:MAG: hypothetical protein JF602_03420 [Gemmatimonadetes bacterium]|nr:hypothetical protein [Gemmatimonadota bacterium]
MSNRLSLLAPLFLAIGPGSRPPAGRVAAPPRFEVSFTAAAHAAPVTGRLIVVLAKAAEPEPRMLVSPLGPPIFAIDLDQLRPAQVAVVDSKAIGYPASLAELPEGDYYAQAVIDVYTQVHRADGHTIWVHMNDGHIEVFQIAAGNLYSDVQRVHVGAGGTVKLAINHVIAKGPPDEDTEWVKHVSIQSQKLTQFWGRPIFVHATVLLPKGYAEHPDARYPSIYSLGHGTPFQFSTTAGRGCGTINPVTGTECGYDFYKEWITDSMPRVIAISLEQQTPYFPDSYSVNSANNGPYGDAIVDEVMPALEEKFRIIRQPYGRVLEGASTSGWQTLAMMLQHPDFFGGAFVLQPDPIDFPVPPHDAGPGRLDDASIESLRGRARQPWTLVISAGGMGSRVRPGWRRRLPAAALGQAHGQDRSRGGRVHARPRLRPSRIRAAELVDTRSEARRQAALLRRRHGRLLSQPRGVRLSGNAQVVHESTLRGGVHLRAADEGALVARLDLGWLR